MPSMRIGFDSEGKTEFKVNVEVTIKVPSDWGFYDGYLHQGRPRDGGGSSVRFQLNNVAEQLQETLANHTEVEDEYPWYVTDVKAV